MYVRPHKFNKLVYEAAYLTEKKTYWEIKSAILEFLFLFFCPTDSICFTIPDTFTTDPEKNQCIQFYLNLHLPTDL